MEQVQLFLKPQHIRYLPHALLNPLPINLRQLRCLILRHALKSTYFLLQLVYSGFHVLHICVTLQFVEVHLRHMDTWRFLVPALSFHAIWQHWCIAAINSYDNCKQVSSFSLRSRMLVLSPFNTAQTAVEM